MTSRPDFWIVEGALQLALANSKVGKTSSALPEVWTEVVNYAPLVFDSRLVAGRMFPADWVRALFFKRAKFSCICSCCNRSSTRWLPAQLRTFC